MIELLDHHVCIEVHAGLNDLALYPEAQALCGEVRLSFRYDVDEEAPGESKDKIDSAVDDIERCCCRLMRLYHMMHMKVPPTT
jgi:hypothetical protein